MEVKKAIDEICHRIAKNRDPLCVEYHKKIKALQDNFFRNPVDSEGAFWFLILDNIQWLINKGVISVEDLAGWFDLATLNAHGFYINQKGIEIINGKACLFNCGAKIAGHSRVFAFGGGNVLKAFDTSCVSIYGGNIEARDCMVDAFGDAVVKMTGYGKVEAYDRVHVELSGYSYLICADESTFNKTIRAHVVKL